MSEIRDIKLQECVIEIVERIKEEKEYISGFYKPDDFNACVTVTEAYIGKALSNKYMNITNKNEVVERFNEDMAGSTSINTLVNFALMDLTEKIDKENNLYIAKTYNYNGKCIEIRWRD